MSRYKLSSPIRELHGKLCSHDDVIYMERYGTRYTSKICFPRTRPYSEAELARQSKFKQACEAAHAALADAELRASAELRFKKQRKYKTLIGMVVSEEYKKIN